MVASLVHLTKWHVKESLMQEVAEHPQQKRRWRNKNEVAEEN